MEHLPVLVDEDIDGELVRQLVVVVAQDDDGVAVEVHLHVVGGEHGGLPFRGGEEVDGDEAPAVVARWGHVGVGEGARRASTRCG